MSVANLHETSPDFDQASPKVGGGVVTDDSATLFLKLADWARAMSDKDDSDDGNGEEFGFLPRFPVYDEDKLAIEEICSLFRTHLSGMQPAHIALSSTGFLSVDAEVYLDVYTKGDSIEIREVRIEDAYAWDGYDYTYTVRRPAVETIDHIANDIYSAVYNDAAWCEEAWEQAHIGGGVA